MTTTVRHLGTANPDTAFSTIERRSIAVNTANRQIAVGDEAAGTTGAPLTLIAVRYYDTRARYAAGDYVINAGILLRAKAAVAPGAFSAAQWDNLDPALLLPLDGSRVMTGDLTLANSTPSNALHAASKGYVDPAFTAIAAANADIALRVLKSGDGMTGNLTISLNGPTLALNRTGAAAAQISGYKAALLRWTMVFGDGTAEGGSNSGSDLTLTRYTDAGAVIDTPLVINRATGLATIIGNPTAALGIAPKQYVDTAVAGAVSGSANKVDRAGDTMTGDLTISKTSPFIYMNKGGSAEQTGMMAQRGGVARWFLSLADAATEAGSNAGSDCTLYRYADNGSFLGTAFGFNRATGLGTVTGNPTAALGIAPKQYVDALIPAGTSMLFLQNSAPTGWTKQTGLHDRALRIVNTVGGGVGGSLGFASCFSRTTTDGRTLSVAELAAHDHQLAAGAYASIAYSTGVAGGTGWYNPSILQTGLSFGVTTGSNAAHSLGMDIRVAYVDVIQCSKN